MKSNRCKFRLICLWTKSLEREYFPKQKRAKAGCRVITEIPYCQFAWEWSLDLGRKISPDCLLDRHNTMHLSKEVALSLLKMSAQYNTPFISYLGWMVNYSNTISYSTPQRDSKSLQLDCRSTCACAGFLCTSCNASCFLFATYRALFPINNLHPLIRNGIFNALFLHQPCIPNTAPCKPQSGNPRIEPCLYRKHNNLIRWEMRQHCAPLNENLPKVAFLFCLNCSLSYIIPLNFWTFVTCLLPLTQLPVFCLKHLWSFGYWLFIRLLFKKKTHTYFY